MLDLGVLLDSELTIRDYVMKTAFKAHSILFYGLVTISCDRNNIIGEDVLPNIFLMTCYQIYS